MLEDKIKAKAEDQAEFLLYQQGNSVAQKIHKAIQDTGIYDSFGQETIAFCDLLKKPLTDFLINKMENELLDKAK